MSPGDQRPTLGESGGSTSSRCRLPEFGGSERQSRPSEKTWKFVRCRKRQHFACEERLSKSMSLTLSSRIFGYRSGLVMQAASPPPLEKQAECFFFMCFCFLAYMSFCSFLHLVLITTFFNDPPYVFEGRLFLKLHVHVLLRGGEATLMLDLIKAWRTLPRWLR